MIAQLPDHEFWFSVFVLVDFVVVRKDAAMAGVDIPSRRPLLNISHQSSFVTVRDLSFAFYATAAAHPTMRHRCVCVSDGKLLMTNCEVTSDSGIGVCVLRCVLPPLGPAPSSFAH